LNPSDEVIAKVVKEKYAATWRSKLLVTLFEEGFEESFGYAQKHV